MKIYKATYFENTQPLIEEIECIKMDDLYFYTAPSDEQIARYNSTSQLRQLREQADRQINHFRTRQEAFDYLDKFLASIVGKARRVYEKLKNRHLEFLR